MPDYIYLLQNRLSPAQQYALSTLREAAREAGMTIFLTGGAVRDLTSGSRVRDLDVTVQGDARALREFLLREPAENEAARAPAVLSGEHEPSRTLYFRFPGGARVEVSTARREEYPKPGEPTYEWGSLLEDLRRRDFTVNAMALSLNDGSYGLLMDPTNGVADLESRTLRLVSNYGFLEDPIRLIRAARMSARLGWTMDERTQARFDNAREEGVLDRISPFSRGYELEEIGYEENPLEMIRTLEAAGWMQVLYPAWTSAKADAQGLEQMHEVLTRLQMQGIQPEGATAAMELLTAKMTPEELAGLKKLFVRRGFLEEWARLDEDATEFAKRLTSKDAATPSATWKLFIRANPEAVLWLGLTGKGSAVQNKFKNFLNVWPESRTKVPTALMQELRITPELERYPELLEELFYATIDGKLETEEQLRAFLEPYSPPAPPPPVTVRRPRASKKAEKKQVAAAKEEGTEGLLATAPEPYQEEEEQEEVDASIPGMDPVPGLSVAASAEKPAAELSTPPAEAKRERKAAPAKTAESRPEPAVLESSPVAAAGRLAGVKIAQQESAGQAPPTKGKNGLRPARAPEVKELEAARSSAAKSPSRSSQPAGKPAAKGAAKANSAKASAEALSSGKRTTPVKAKAASPKASPGKKSAPGKQRQVPKAVLKPASRPAKHAGGGKATRAAAPPAKTKPAAKPAPRKLAKKSGDGSAAIKRALRPSKALSKALVAAKGKAAAGAKRKR